jgi:hypothetical protein
MKKEDVESYVRKMLWEEFSLPLKENADLRLSDPIRYVELCRKGIDWMADEIQKDETLYALCLTASLNFKRVIEEERQRAMKIINDVPS